jgi:hypothetical protein
MPNRKVGFIPRSRVIIASNVRGSSGIIIIIISFLAYSSGFFLSLAVSFDDVL